MDFDGLIKTHQSIESTFGRLATVTQASPLRVRIDGDTDALGFTPDTLVAGLAVSDRVWVQIINRRLVVIGRFGGLPAGSVTSSMIADTTIATGDLANDAVTNAKMANMSQATVKGRASGAGTGDPTDLSAAQVRTILGSARMGCSLRRTTNQTLNDSTGTSISWNVQDADTDNLWSSGTTVTIPADGIWAITATVSVAALATGRSLINIATSTSLLFRSAWQAGEAVCTVTAVVFLASGTTFTVDVFSDMAGNSTMTGSLYCYRVSV